MHTASLNWHSPGCLTAGDPSLLASACAWGADECNGLSPVCGFQGPQGFQGNPGEPGEPGAAVSIKAAALSR